MPLVELQRCLRLCLLVCVFCVSVASGTDYYLSPTGDDGNSGLSADSAFRSIEKAAGLVAPGDTVHLAAGVYPGRVVMKTSGTAEAPIVFSGPATGEAVWTMTLPDPKGWDKRFACVLNGRSHIVLERITFRDCGAWLMMFDTNHCTIRDCVFDGCRMYNGIQLKNSNYNRFLNCKFIKALTEWNWIEMNQWCKGYPNPGADYIEIYFSSSRNLVENCEFGSIQHVGVSISAYEGGNKPVRNIVRNCVFRSPRWKALGCGDGAYALIENNFFTGEAANFFQMEGPSNIVRRNIFAGYRLSKEAKGNHEYINGAILMASKVDFRKCDFFCQDNHIFNNLFYDNEKVTTAYSWPEPLRDNIFKNNIFLRNGVTVYLPAPDPDGVNANYFLGNIFFNDDPKAVAVNIENKPMTLTQAVSALPKQYVGNVEVDPALSDPAKGDFSLRKDSPCIDAAMALTTTVAAGSGKKLQVKDALYFCDGNGLIAPDVIRIGDAPAVSIAAVDYEKKIITLKEARVWPANASVNLDYAGNGPDIGPKEYGIHLRGG